MLIKPSKLKPSALLLALGLAGAAQAELIASDWKVVGDQRVVWDTATNLDWLHLGETSVAGGSGQGQSFNSVSAQLSDKYAGFRFALSDDIWTFFANAGIAPSYPAPSPQTRALVNLWSDGVNIGSGYKAASAITGSYAADQSGRVWVAVAAYQAAPDQFPGSSSFANATYMGIMPDMPMGNTGAALIRQHVTVTAVPEVQSLWMLLAGLAGLSLARRGKSSTGRPHHTA